VTCAACGNVRSRPQHEDAAEEAEASLCPIWARVEGGAASHFATSADKLWRCSLKNSIVQAGPIKPVLLYNGIIDGILRIGLLWNTLLRLVSLTN
jgi:hypothetical protein